VAGACQTPWAEPAGQKKSVSDLKTLILGHNGFAAGRAAEVRCQPFLYLNTVTDLTGAGDLPIFPRAWRPDSRL